MQRADLGGELVQRSGDQRQRSHIFGMAVTLQGLRGDRCRAGAQLAADELFHERVDVGISADRAGDFTELHAVRSMAEALQVAFHFLIPQRHLESKGRRLSVNAMCASHHRRILVSYRFILKNFNEVNDVLLQNFVRLAQQVTQRRINNIRGG